MGADRDREEQALDWVRRTHDPEFGDWDAHLAWLEADPANAAAFDRMALAMEDATTALLHAPLREPTPSNDNLELRESEAAADRPRRFGWGARVGALAASLAAVVGLTTLVRQPLPFADQAVAYSTELGQRRTVRLDDGTTIAMNGGSAIRVGTGNGRKVRVDRGEIYLDVVHDPANPLRVAVGDVDLVDVGTAFNVRREGTAITIGVQEGEVNVDPDGAAVRLAAGQQLRKDGDDVVLDRVERASIGCWRNGRLIYRDAPLKSVAADLSRAIGETVVVEPSADAVRFTGVLEIDKDRARLFRRLAAVADVNIRRYKGEWRVAATGN